MTDRLEIKLLSTDMAGDTFLAEASPEAVALFKQQAAKMNDWIRSPTRMLPLSWRLPVMGFLADYGYLIGPHLLTLCKRCRDYHVAGVTLDELRGLFDQIKRREMRGVDDHDFHHDVFGALAVMVGMLLRQKEAAAKTKERREADASDAANAVKSLAEHFALGGMNITPTEGK